MFIQLRLDLNTSSSLEIRFGNLNDKTAKLSMMTFAYRSTSYLVSASGQQSVSTAKLEHQ